LSSGYFCVEKPKILVTLEKSFIMNRMQNHRLFLSIGILLLILPFLGIPQTWKHFILFVLGLAFIAVALIARNQDDEGHTLHERVFVENNFDDQVSNEDTDDVVEEVVEFTIEEPLDPTYLDEPRGDQIVEEEELHEQEEVEEILVAEEIVPVKKPRKKRVSKKPTVKDEMEEPVLVSADIAGIIEDIDESFDDSK